MAKKIMVVDDQPDTVELAKAVLEIGDFEVLDFTRPREALEALKKGGLPDLLILDIRMPDLSGPDLCKLIRSDSAIKSQKIVYFTASSDADMKLLREDNVLGYIFKPFDNDNFIREVKKYLAM